MIDENLPLFPPPSRFIATGDATLRYTANNGYLSCYECLREHPRDVFLLL